VKKRRSPDPVKPDPVSPDDAALFREAIGEVQRIEVDAAATTKPPPAPAARMRARDEAEALRESRFAPASAAAFVPGEALSFRRDEVAPRTLRRLAAGEFSVRDELDLHLLPALEAEKLLKQFLHHVRDDGGGCVRVIHGKGLRSEHGPVLKAMVDGVLRHRGDVLAFASAPAAQGGTGAVLVLIGRS
jgi:DNA-nicking Smr family endonuclease